MEPQVSGDDESLEMAKKVKLDSAQTSSFSSQSKMKEPEVPEREPSTPNNSRSNWRSDMDEELTDDEDTPTPEVIDVSSDESMADVMEEINQEVEEEEEGEAEEGQEEVVEEVEEDEEEVEEIKEKVEEVREVTPPKDLINGMPKYMKIFDKVKLTPKDIEPLRLRYYGWLELADIPFDNAHIGSSYYPREVFTLAAELVQKRKMLHIAEHEMMNMSGTKGVKLTEKMLAFLTFLLVRIKVPSVGKEHFEKAGWFLEHLAPDDVANVLLDIIKDYFSHVDLFMQGKKTKEPLWDLSEEFYDHMFESNPTLHTDCLLFLISLKEYMEPEPEEEEEE